MRKVHVQLVFEVTLVIKDEDIDLADVIEGLVYTFEDTTDTTMIPDADFVDWEVIKA